MKTIAINRKAHFDYVILETIEAGIVLKGDEVKSIRQGHVSLADCFATVNDGQICLLNCYIAPYSHAYVKHDASRRTRLLLLHKKEINRLIGDISRKGITLIPLKIYFNQRGFIKLEIGVAKHKKSFDKKELIKEKDIKREAEREIKMRIR